MKAITIFMGLLLISLLVIGCGSPSTSPTTSPPPQTSAGSPAVYNVAISNFSFSPQEITIKSGDMVVWTNNDSVTHTVTGSGWGSSSLKQGETYSRTFDTVGTYEYYCTLHPSMKGSVVVE
jgi:plastocyanin